MTLREWVEARGGKSSKWMPGDARIWFEYDSDGAHYSMDNEDAIYAVEEREVFSSRLAER